MKTRHICPECQGTDIYKRTIDARGGYGPDLLPKVGGFWTGAKFEIYICGTCGYSQLYVPERYLADVRQKYERA